MKRKKETLVLVIQPHTALHSLIFTRNNTSKQPINVKQPINASYLLVLTVNGTSSFCSSCWRLECSVPIAPILAHRKRQAISDHRSGTAALHAPPLPPLPPCTLQAIALLWWRCRMSSAIARAWAGIRRRRRRKVRKKEKKEG